MGNLKILSSKEARENGRKGGLASVESRRERKLMREAAELILSLPMEAGRCEDVERIRSLAAIEGKNITVQEAILLAQVKKALVGDTRAAEFIRDTMGEKPTNKVDMNGGIPKGDFVLEIVADE